MQFLKRKQRIKKFSVKFLIQKIGRRPLILMERQKFQVKNSLRSWSSLHRQFGSTSHMLRGQIIDCIDGLKLKNTEGYDFKVGMNSLTNRLTHIIDVIPLTWLNMSIDPYKVHCKKMFL